MTYSWLPVGLPCVTFTDVWFTICRLPFDLVTLRVVVYVYAVRLRTIGLAPGRLHTLPAPGGRSGFTIPVPRCWWLIGPVGCSIWLDVYCVGFTGSYSYLLAVCDSGYVVV